MGLEEVNGPKEVQREREVTNPWVVCDVESEKGPQQAWSNASKESKGLMASLWALRMKDMVIGLGKPKRVTKSPWECRVRKNAKEVQGKQMGQGWPRGNKWDERAHKQCNTKPKWPY